MTKLKIKTGDKVIILSGNYKGKIGIIKKTEPKNNKVIISGINIIKKRIKSINNSYKKDIVKKESPLHISKVAILDVKTGKPTKIGITMNNNKKNRLLKKSGDYI